MAAEASSISPVIDWAEPAPAQEPRLALPLTGVRVLDLGHVFAGPYAAFLMAMAGADVIKVEPPTGDMSRRRGSDGDYPFRALNGCKRGIVLNLKTDRGRELLLSLAEKADVLVENFAPSVMPRLGLAPEVLLERNPRLIYASSTGFGRSGPYSQDRALDLTIQAMSGIMSTTGEPDGPPLKAGVPIADFNAGAHLYGGILSALVQRSRTGRGRIVEVSMLESLFATLLPSAGHSYVTNQPPERRGNRHVADSYVPFDVFHTSDGWVAIVCATDDHWERLTKAMDRPDLHDDVELRSLHGRIARIEEVTDAIAAWAAPRTRAEVAAACQQAQVVAAPLRDVVEVLDDPHLRARGFLSPLAGASDDVAFPNSPIRYDGSALRPLTRAPELGEHTNEVLAELCGLDAEAIAELRLGGVVGG